MKKALFAALCCLLAVSACKKNETEAKVTGVSVSPTTLSLVEGTSEQLRATVTPSDAADKTVSWTSSDAAVATVDNTGKVTAVKAGSATITVKTADGGKTATCAVSVTALVVPVTDISIKEGPTVQVEQGKTVTLTAKVLPENATDKTVTWTSSDLDVATVAEGVVTGQAPGDAVITAKAGDKETTCAVTVIRSSVAFEGIDLGLSVKWGNKNVGAEFPEDPGDYFAWGETAVKDNYTLENYVFGPDLTQASKYFGSGRTVLEEADDAARVNLGEGWRMPTQDEWDELIHQCTAQWTTQNDKTGVLVTAQSGASIFLPAAGVCNDYGNPWSLGAQGFYWSSSPVSEKYGLNWLTVIATHFFDPGVAEHGVIESVYGSLYEGYSVRPVFAEYVHVTGVSLNKDTETLAPDETLQLTATVSPENALEKAVKWTSSDETVATVTKGLVTAKGTGTATITVTTLDGEKTATCQISVENASVDYAAVDMGLSVKWCNKNVGANRPEDAGNYYAWGEVSTKDNYTWTNYRWGSGTLSFDVLAAEDDIASVTLGEDWRMPSMLEIQELLGTASNAHYKWEFSYTEPYHGWMITYLENGNSIFIPLAGRMIGEQLISAQDAGCYWSQLASYGLDDKSIYLAFFRSDGVMNNSERYVGMPVRPVSGPRDKWIEHRGLADATSDDLGCLVTQDGIIVGSVSQAVWEGRDAAGIIVYVGSETGEDNYKHGLVMSMQDCASSTGYFKWKTTSGKYDNPKQSSSLYTQLGYKESGRALSSADRDNDTWPAFQAAMNNAFDPRIGVTDKTPSVNNSGWFLPSIYQWQQAIHGMTGKTKIIDFYTANPDYVAAQFNAKISDSRYGLIQQCYCSSSEYDETYNWHFDFNDGITRRNAKWCDYRVRAFFAF